MTTEPSPTPFPKIELHVHLEGAVKPRDLLEIARRNDLSLPADNETDLARLYEFRDFQHFLEMWLITTNVIRTERDFKQVVLSYAEQASSHGAVYIEGIFTPAERIAGGASWDEVFSGFCDGAADAKERFGIDVRLTVDIGRGMDLDTAIRTARYAVKYKERGIVGVGLGGPEAEFPPEPYEKAFLIAKEGGVGSVPHAGEAAGAASVRGAVEVLLADRIRHGFRVMEDPGLARELADRQIVCDVCPISNLRTGVVRSLAEHPLPDMTRAGILCTVNTDDPAMFETDLSQEHEAAAQIGTTPKQAFEAGVVGALCDEMTRSRLKKIGEAAF